MLEGREGRVNFFFILISGIAIICMGFVFAGCGKDPQWKVADSDKGQYALDFSKAPGVIGVAWGNNPTNMPSIKDTELTVEAWIKSKSDSLTGAIFGRMDSHGVVLYVNNNEPKFSIRRYPLTPELRCTPLDATSTECTVSSGLALAKDEWTHLAGVLVNEDHTGIHGACGGAEREKPHLDIYVNGEFRGCATTDSMFADDPSAENHLVAIGLTGDGLYPDVDGTITTQTRFDGVIDEVRFWRVARTQAQIQGCMGQELTFDKPGDCYVDPSILIGYWRLNEGQGHKIFDISGTGSSGSIESPGGTSWSGGWVEGAPITKD